MRTFRSLSVVLILLFLTTNVYPSDNEKSDITKNHKEAIEELKVCATLLSEEKDRWTKLHTNPVADKWNVTKLENGDMSIHIEIDTGVQNIINDQPISRTYTLEPENKHLIPYCDVLLGAQLVYPEGPRPLVGIGFSPKLFRGIGIAAETSLMGISAGVYYVPPQIPYAAIFAGPGINIKNETTFSAGICLIF